MTLTQIVTDPLLLAGVVSVVGFFGARYRPGRSSVKACCAELKPWVAYPSKTSVSHSARI